MVDLSRRQFVAGTSAALTIAGCAAASPEAAEPEDTEVNEQPLPRATSMPTRPLGKTGERVSAIGLGGYHLGNIRDEQACIALVRDAIDRGVTFMDNCWDYHEGESEQRMGKALADGYRSKVFLMTKLDGRTKQAAIAQIDQSLKRLRTDVIDLMQIHEIIRMEDPERCFAEGGCVEALVDARNAGKIRFVGFTGHKDPAIHLRMLAVADENGFAFDTVQMPLNVMDAHYKSFEKDVLPVLVDKNIGVLGMKCLGAGEILKANTVTALECIHYAMNLPTSVVITGIESRERLDQAMRAALSFSPMDPDAVAALLARTREAAQRGELEKFKTSTKHDGTTQNPHWLTTAEP
ncbi:MAG: aldo/keto reductase [Polyangiaceae bacterium]|nr:aldo/keto reductase [Polyangiaceae bacterium]